MPTWEANLMGGIPDSRRITSRSSKGPSGPQLCLKRGLQHLTGQPGQQPVRAGQIDALLARGSDQLVCHGRHIRRWRQDLACSRINLLALFSCQRRSVSCQRRSGVRRVTHLPARLTPRRSRRTPHTRTSRQTPRSRHWPPLSGGPRRPASAMGAVRAGLRVAAALRTCMPRGLATELLFGIESH